MSARRNRAAAIVFCFALIGALAVSLVMRLAPPATAALSLAGEATSLALCAIAAATLCARAGRRLFARPAITPFGGLCVALCFLVAANNLPWLALLTGAARVTAGGGEILLFALVCLLTAVFEELLFRGFLFSLCLARFTRGGRGRLAAILLSSAVFALSHLFNLAAGANLPGTLLQVGYSFLVGCAAAVLMLHTHNLVVPILFHAVYNFGGLLIPRLGEGQMFDRPTVIFTAALAILTAALLALSLFWGKKDGFFTPAEQEKTGNTERF